MSNPCWYSPSCSVWNSGSWLADWGALMPFNARFACFNNFFTPQRFRNWLHYRSSLLRYRALSSNVKTISDFLFILMNRWLASCGMGDVSVKHSHQSLTLKTLINENFLLTALHTFLTTLIGRIRLQIKTFCLRFSLSIFSKPFCLTKQQYWCWLLQKLPIDSLSVHYLTRNTQLFSCLYCHLTD